MGKSIDASLEAVRDRAWHYINGVGGEQQAMAMAHDVMALCDAIGATQRVASGVLESLDEARKLAAGLSLRSKLGLPRPRTKTPNA